VTFWGGIVGVGIEHALTPAWSLKAEYDYVGLGRSNVANVGAIDAWEEQMKSPNPMTAPPALLSKLNSLTSISPAGSWPDANSLRAAAMNPMQFWMQSAEQLQKAWAQALDFWARAGKDAGERYR
jgi:hypothetical protein